MADTYNSGKVSWGTCKYCDQKIVWARMPEGHFLPMDPQGNGVHECIPLYRSNSSALGGYSHPARATRPTKCWWCTRPVFYHTNGYGDAVLFDDLGYPWNVHHCWEVHAGERGRAPQESIAGLGDKTIYESAEHGTYKLVPFEDPGYGVEITGFVSKIYPKSIARTYPNQDKQNRNVMPGWMNIDVVDGSGALYPFSIQRGVGDKVAVYDVLRISGRWGHRGGLPALFASAYEVLSYGQES